MIYIILKNKQNHTSCEEQFKNDKISGAHNYFCSKCAALFEKKNNKERQDQTLNS